MRSSIAATPSPRPRGGHRGQRPGAFDRPRDRPSPRPRATVRPGPAGGSRFELALPRTRSEEVDDAARAVSESITNGVSFLVSKYRTRKRTESDAVTAVITTPTATW